MEHHLPSSAAPSPRSQPMGLVAPAQAMEAAAWPPKPAHQPTTDGRPFNRPTPSCGISFIKCRGGCWQLYRFVRLCFFAMWARLEHVAAGARRLEERRPGLSLCIWLP